MRKYDEEFKRLDSAATAGDVPQAQLADLADVKPDLIALCVGADDLINGVKPEEFARNYAAIVARLKAQAAGRVVLMNIPDLSLAPAVPEYMRAAARRHVIHGRLPDGLMPEDRLGS